MEVSAKENRIPLAVARSDFIIPLRELEDGSDSRSVTRERWLELRREAFRDRADYFYKSVSDYLYPESNRWKQLNKEGAFRLVYGSYEGQESQDLMLPSTIIRLHGAQLVEFDFQTFLILRVELPSELSAAIEANHWMSQLRFAVQSDERRPATLSEIISTEGLEHHKEELDVSTFANRLVRSEGWQVDPNVVRAFVHCILVTDAYVPVERLDPGLAAARDFRLPYEDTIVDNEFDQQAVWQRFELSLTSFTAGGSLTFASGCLPNGSEHKFNKKHLVEHTLGIYRDLGLLALYQRNALNEISFRLSRLSDILAHRKQLTFTRLFLLKFTNRSWFSQVSYSPHAQIMWDYWQRNLDIRELYEEVAKQMELLNQYVSQVSNWRLTVALAAITGIGWPITLVMTWIGGDWRHKVGWATPLHLRLGYNPVVDWLLVLYLIVASLAGYALWSRTPRRFRESLEKTVRASKVEQFQPRRSGRR